MSGSLPSGRRLLWRVGPYFNARPMPAESGTTVTVIFELVDNQTQALVPAYGLSVIAWRPVPGGFETQGVPLEARLLSPGRWEVDCELEMSGLYSIQAVTLGDSPRSRTAKIQSV